MSRWTQRGFLVAQWLRNCLPMQETRVQSLVWEDPTRLRATKPVSHNCWACALGPRNGNYWAQKLHYWSPCTLEPVLITRETTSVRTPCTAMQSTPHAQQWRPNTTLKKKTSENYTINLLNRLLVCGDSWFWWLLSDSRDKWNSICQLLAHTSESAWIRLTHSVAVSLGSKFSSLLYSITPSWYLFVKTGFTIQNANAAAADP